MALLYSLVARGTTVLAECSKSNSAECKKVAQGLLAKFEGEENLRRSLTHGNFDYCLISDPHVVYLCAGVASKEMTTSTMLGFLSDIKDKWNATVSLSEIEAATTLSLNERFSRTLEVKMDYYSNDQVNQVKKQLDDAKQIMTKNIESVIDRGDSMSHIYEQSNALTDQAAQFRKSSSELRWYMQKKNIKLMIFMAVLVVFVLYCMVASLCGGVFFHDCFADDSDTQ